MQNWNQQRGVQQGLQGASQQATQQAYAAQQGTQSAFNSQQATQQAYNQQSTQQAYNAQQSAQQQYQGLIAQHHHTQQQPGANIMGNLQQQNLQHLTLEQKQQLMQVLQNFPQQPQQQASAQQPANFQAQQQLQLQQQQQQQQQQQMLLSTNNQQLLQQATAIQQANQLQMQLQQQQNPGGSNVLLQGLPGNVLQSLQKQIVSNQQSPMVSSYTGKLSTGQYISQEKAMLMAQQTDRYGGRDSHQDSKGRGGGSGSRDQGRRGGGASMYHDDRRGSDDRRGGGANKRTRDVDRSRGKDMDTQRRGKEHYRQEQKPPPKPMHMQGMQRTYMDKPRRDRSPPPKRDKSPARGRAGGGARAASPPTPGQRKGGGNAGGDYGVRLSPFRFSTCERDYVDIARRYQNLMIPVDFAKLVCNWTQVNDKSHGSYGCALVPLDRPVTVDAVVPVHKEKEKTSVQEDPAAAVQAPPQVPPATATIEGTDGDVVYNAKVVPCLGLDEKAIKMVKDGQRNGGEHLLNLLKFLVGKVEKHGERSQIQCFGGKHDAQLDGPNPEQDQGVLVNTCIRWVKDILGLDLSASKVWVRFLEISYLRELGEGKGHVREITTLFLVDVSQCLPAEEEWPELWKQHSQLKKVAKDFEREKYAAKHFDKRHKEEEKRNGKKEYDTTIKTVKASDAPDEDMDKEDDKQKEDAQKEGADEQPKEDAQEEKPKAEAETEAQEDAKTDDAMNVDEPEKKDEPKKDEEKEADKEEAGEEKPEKKEKTAEEILAEEFPLPEGPPQLLIQTQVCAGKKWKVMPISLNGLLDYDETDKEEGTFELSLFAESFHEMLMRDYGEVIMEALYVEQKKTIENREKRKLAEAAAKLEAQKKKEEEEKLAAEKAEKERLEKEKQGDEKKEGEEQKQENGSLEPQTKKLKLDEKEEHEEEDEGAEMELEMKEDMEEEVIMLDDNNQMQVDDDKTKEGEEQKQKEEDKSKGEGEEGQDQEQGKEKSEKDSEKKAEQKEEKEKIKEVDEPLLWAFRYFDQTGAGYYKIEDLRRLIHCLGHCLSSKIVKELALNVAETKGRHRYERVYYRDITDKVTYKEP